MNNFQDQGRAAYKRDDYNKAIECFSRAIGRGASVQLLDNRAASYEKLGELSAALQDAKAAIQLNREDATGYLRAAKVLRRMEKHAVALDIATHGLKCIKHFGQGYEVSSLHLSRDVQNRAHLRSSCCARLASSSWTSSARRKGWTLSRFCLEKLR